MVAAMPLARPAAWLEPRLVRGDLLVPKRFGHWVITDFAWL